MAGHGPYVWTCYAITFSVLGYLVAAPLLRQRRFFTEQQRLQRLQAHQRRAQ